MRGAGGGFHERRIPVRLVLRRSCGCDEPRDGGAP
jgi:hypothetical protein